MSFIDSPFFPRLRSFAPTYDESGLQQEVALARKSRARTKTTLGDRRLTVTSSSSCALRTRRAVDNRPFAPPTGSRLPLSPDEGDGVGQGC